MVEAGKDSTWLSLDHPEHGYPFLYPSVDGAFEPDRVQRQAFDAFMGFFDRHLKGVRREV
jgi:hypothetical protein